ncbi:hypothetical protein ACXC9Q_17480 [Kribbella sp. CWNU-51]
MRQGPGLDLAQELLAMAAEDEAVRAELVADGSLFEGYHSRMAEVHRRNAERRSWCFSMRSARRR